MREIREVLGEALSREEMGRVMDLLEAKRAWKELPFSLPGEPCGLRGGRLVVRVGSHAWAQELVFRKEEIIKALERKTGRKVEDIIFKVKP